MHRLENSITIKMASMEKYESYKLLSFYKIVLHLFLNHTLSLKVRYVLLFVLDPDIFFVIYKTSNVLIN